MIENLEGQQAPTLQLGDAAAVVASILGGAHIVRVHDVAGVLPAVRIADAVLTASRAGWNDEAEPESCPSDSLEKAIPVSSSASEW